MARMYLVALATLITATTTPVWAQNYGGGSESLHIRSHTHFEERLTFSEQHGGSMQSYRPTRSVPRDILSIIFGFGANRPERQAVRHAQYCERGGQLGRLPNGEVACITAVRTGDPRIQTRRACPNGGYWGALPDEDQDVCITEEHEAGQLVTVHECPHGGHLGRIRGVNHEVCVLN